MSPPLKTLTPFWSCLEEPEIELSKKIGQLPPDSMRAEFNYLRNTINKYIDPARKATDERL